MLNVFQQPCATVRHRHDGRLVVGLAWTLKQVQGDESWGSARC